METKLTPKTANTNAKIRKLKRDNISTRKSWLSLSGDGKTLNITNQKNGEERTGTVTLTYKEFERFIKFYETGI